MTSQAAADPCTTLPFPTLPPLAALSPKASAARFLNQASFGATHESIDDVTRLGYARWIDQQMAMRGTSHRAYYRDNLARYANNPKTTRQNGWWDISVNAPDQLRQRVAFALSQIFVVSELNLGLNRADGGISTYYDLLVDNAFGDYRQLLERVTLSPVMGRYLSMLGNPRPDPAAGVLADENFAREVMQLFSVGTRRLGADGTPLLDRNGQPLPSYRQAHVEGLARALTGWSFEGATILNPRSGDFDRPMRVFRPSGGGPGDFHDTDAKTLIGEVQLPAGQSAEQDLAQAMDTLAAHPNVAPFIGRQLIQHLVTSNPTPGYVLRVSRAFRASGGNLGVTVRAILLDPEARQGYILLGRQFGRAREPLQVVTHLWRAFHGHPSGNNGVTGFSFANAERSLVQAPFRAPSVFNFFQPDYQPPFERRGVNTAGPCTVAPELQLSDESTNPATSAFLSEATRRFEGTGGETRDTVHNIRLRYDRQAPLASRSTDALLDDLNLLLLSGQMTPGMRQILRSYVEADTVVSDSPELRVSKAVYMIMSSPQYLIQR